MPREHCHKTDTFLPEPTAASHPCSAEKRKNKCPATPRRRDRRRTGRGSEDTPCMNAPPSPPPEKHGLPWAQDTPHGLRDLHGAARADGGSAPDRSVPARRPLSIRTPSLQPLPGRAAPADDPQPGPAEHDPRPEETADRSPGKTSGHPRRKKRKKRALHGEGPRRSPEEAADNPGRSAACRPTPSADVSGDGNRGVREE